MTSKKSTVKKTSASKRKPSTGRKTKKAKVYVSPYKALILCFAVILFCLCLLLIVSSLDKSNNNPVKELPSVAERFENKSDNKIEKKSEKKESPSVDKENAKNASDKEKVVRKEESKPIQETPATTPSTEQKKEPVKTETQTATTTKPAVTEQKNVTASSYNFPKAVNNAQLIFIFDDGGQNLSHLEAFLKLPFPITVAVLPQLAHSSESAKRVRNSGNELMLHQPMQAVNKAVNPGPGAITPEMTEDEIISTLFNNINEIGPIAGMNNHEGSAITADAEKMEIILKTASENGIFFLDSRTNSETQVPYVANALGYSWYERNIFLDNEKTKANALKELERGLTIANKNGSVIMIGHVWSADFLPAFLKEVYPELKEKGYTFSVVSKSKAKKY